METISTARAGKVDALRLTIGAEYPTTLEIVQIDDAATGDFTEALKGTHLLRHSMTSTKDR